MNFKKITALLLILAMCIPMLGFAATATDAADEEPVIEVLTVNLDNAVEYSKGIIYAEIDPILHDDIGKAIMCKTPQQGGSYVVWEAENEFRSVALEFFWNRWRRPDFYVYVSKDMQTWDFASVNIMGMNKKYHTDVWEATQVYHYAVECNNLGDSYKYVKVVYPDTARSSDIALISIHFSPEDEYFLGTGGRSAHYQKPLFDYSSIPSLAKEYEDYFEIGCSIEPWDIDNYYDLLTTQFSQITNENQFKGHVVHTGPGQWYFASTDNMVDWALSEGKEFRGHCLWYHDNHYAGFFNDDKGNLVTPEVANARLKEHVQTIVTRYRGKVKYWDVVNELFDPGSGRLKSGHYEDRILGPAAYVPDLFKWAKEADPDAILLINENSHLIPAQRDGYINQIKKWLDEGVPIDGIGLQWHESLFEDEEDMRDLFEKLRKLGKPVYITEMDMTTYRPYDYDTSYKWEDREFVETEMAKMYGLIFDIFREYSDIIEYVSFWCPTDNRSSVTRGRRYDFPLLFGVDGEPNEAFWYILDFDKKLPRHTEEDELDPRLKKKFPEGYRPLIVPVYEGTAKIDGVMDDAYNKSDVLQINKQCLGKGGATGDARILWDDNYIYTYVTVTDETPDATHAEPWFRDNLELFVSQSNMHVTWRGGGDTQYRIDPTGTLQSFSEGDAVVVATDTGYIYECRLPLTIVKPEPGVMYSFDIGIADARDGMRETINKWCDVTNESSNRTIYWGDIIISDGTTPVPKVDIGFDEEEDASSSASNTVKTPDKLTGNYTDFTLSYNDATSGSKILDNNSVSMIGMRDFLNLTNATVKTATDGTVEISLNGNYMILKLNSNTAIVNGTELALDSAPVTIDSRVWLPLRFMFEKTGATVSFDDQSGTISVIQ